MRDLSVTILAIAILAVGVLTYLKEPNTNLELPLGGSAGFEHSNTQIFQSGLVEGGQLSISTTTSVTLKWADMEKAAVISFSSTQSPVINVTLPASSTWSGLQRVGDSREWVIDNLHTAAATTTTLVAGTGVDLDGTTANDDVVNGGVSAALVCWRLPNTDIRCIVEEMVDAG